MNFFIGKLNQLKNTKWLHRFCFISILLLLIAYGLTYNNIENIFWYHYNPNTVINMSGKLEYYTSAKQENLDTVLKKGAFIKNTSHQISFPSESNYTYVWVRLKLCDEEEFLSNHHSVLAISFPNLIDYRIFMPTADKGYVDITNSQLNHKQALFPNVEIPQNIFSDQYIYFTFMWPSVSMSLNLWDYASFIVQQNKLLVFITINLAIILTLFIINIMLYFTTWDKKYIIHSAFLLTAFVSLFLFSGVYLILSNSPANIASLEFDTLSVLLFSLFMYIYLKTGKRNTFITLTFYLIVITSILYFVAAPMLPYIVDCNIFNFYTFITNGIFTIWILIALINRVRLSSYYVLGLILTDVALSLNLLSQIFDLPFVFLFHYSCLYSSIAVEGFLFTLSIMHQFRVNKGYELCLKDKAYTDPLTKLKNRQYFNEILCPQISGSNREYAMMLFDLDHFKRVNDTYGHDTGDKVLVHTAKLITENTRKSDTVFRWGGEEFLVILPDIDASVLKTTAEKIKTIIERDDYAGIPNVTTSIGLTIHEKEELFTNWFNRTDQALYLAKLLGKNLVEFGYYLPAFIQWLPDFESGNGIIDQQHQALINQSNVMLQLLNEHEKNSKKIDALYNKMVMDIECHFYSEEEILTAIGYPQLESLQASHSQLLSIAKKSLNLPSSKFIIQKLIGDIIFTHLAQEDALFFDYVKSNKG